MSKGLKKAGKIIGGIEDWMVIVLFTAMVVVTMAIVLCRYVFKVQFVPGEEIARYLMIWCGYAGAAMGFRTHAHVGVVVFAEKFPKSDYFTIYSDCSVCRMHKSTDAFHQHCFS